MFATGRRITPSRASDTRKSKSVAEQQQPRESAEPEPEPEPEPTEPEPAADAEAVEVAAAGRVEISVDAKGYHPATISAPAKSKITLAFRRTTELSPVASCRAFSLPAIR